MIKLHSISHEEQTNIAWKKDQKTARYVNAVSFDT